MEMKLKLKLKISKSCMNCPQNDSTVTLYFKCKSRKDFHCYLVSVNLHDLQTFYCLCKYSNKENGIKGSASHTLKKNRHSLVILSHYVVA